MNTATDNMNVLDMPRKEVGILSKKMLRADLLVEQPKRKISKQVMLSSLFVEGIVHDHDEELEKLINEEWQVDLVEVSSGNGAYHTEYNPDGLPMAQANESNPHDSSGLAEQLVDSSKGIMDKNHVDVYDKVVGDMVTIDCSAYSIWETICQKGQLIVRRTAPWANGFNPIKFATTKAKHLKERHNRLLYGNGDTFRAGNANSYEARKQKRLDRIQARMGGSMAKVGYNAYNS